MAFDGITVSAIKAEIEDKISEEELIKFINLRKTKLY